MGYYVNATGNAPELGPDWEPDTHVDDVSEGWEVIPYGDPTTGRGQPDKPTTTSTKATATNTSNTKPTKDNTLIIVVVGVVVIVGAIMLMKR